MRASWTRAGMGLAVALGAMGCPAPAPGDGGDAAREAGGGGDVAIDVAPGGDGASEGGVDAVTMDAPSGDGAGGDGAGADGAGGDAVARDVATDGPAVACDGGAINCGGACVSDWEDNPAHCGTACEVCPSRPNSVTSCLFGACGSLCAASFGDCDHNEANGCETALTTTTNCGACGHACASGQACVMGTCR